MASIVSVIPPPRLERKAFAPIDVSVDGNTTLVSLQLENSDSGIEVIEPRLAIPVIAHETKSCTPRLVKFGRLRVPMSLEQ